MSNPDRAPVVSLMARSAYRADFRGLASAQLRAAREKTGLSQEDFAGHLGEILGWDPDPDLMGRWEAGRGMPPGDVVLAAGYLLAGDTPAAVSVLGSVPESFPAQVLAGFWLTCYDFPHAGVTQYHADVARITAESDRRVRVTNYPPEPRTEGRASPFRNEIEGELLGRHLIGRWKNTSDTRYFGLLHLAVLPGETVMEGRYTGLASDITVSAGCWKWVRIGAGTAPPALRLREPAVLHDLVTARTQNDEPLALADIGEEA